MVKNGCRLLYHHHPRSSRDEQCRTVSQHGHSTSKPCPLRASPIHSEPWATQHPSAPNPDYPKVRGPLPSHNGTTDGQDRKQGHQPTAVTPSPHHCTAKRVLVGQSCKAKRHRLTMAWSLHKGGGGKPYTEENAQPCPLALFPPPFTPLMDTAPESRMGGWDGCRL
jgi:hypothetical protein